MTRLLLLAATIVLSAGMMLGQSSAAGTAAQSPNATPDQAQPGAPQATPPIVPHQRPETSANPDRPDAAPQPPLPNTTVDDQQPGTSSRPSSTMGTAGNTTGTEPSAEGNKSGTTPNNTQTPKTQPSEPHDRYSSGSNSPNSPANGASGDDMSGTNPHPNNSTNSTNPQTTPPHIATHVPDAGTEMNPASLQTVTETTEQH